MRKMAQGGGCMEERRRDEILLAVHGMCNSGGRVPVGLSCRCVDQGEVAPLFSVWMRDKRNRGCFGQTLFGHGQSTYKRGYHLSLSLSLWAKFTRAVRSLSRLHPSLLSPLHHSQLSRALYAACTYTNPPIAFSLALCLMNAHSNTLSRYPTRGKILSLAKTGHSREPLLPRSVYHRFIIIRITRLCLVPLILRFLGFVASRKTRQLFHPFRKASSIVEDV